MNSLKFLWRSTNIIQNVFIVRPSAKIRTLTTAPDTLISTTQEVEPITTEYDKLFKRVELEMRGIDPAVLKSYSWFCVAAASHLGIEVTHSWALRKAEKERLTLLKAVHVTKKHKVQYEIRTYFRFITLQRLTGSTCDTYLEYIERNLPEGTALKVTKIECLKLADHIIPPSKE